MSVHAEQEQGVQMVHTSRAGQHPWYTRIDPVHEIAWQDTTKSYWEDMWVYQHRLRVDPDGHVSHTIQGIVSPVERSDSQLYGHRSIQLMAMLNQWDRLSTLQLSALMNLSKRAVWNTASGLFAAGILRRMIPEWWRWNTGDDLSGAGSGSMWCIDRSFWTTRKWVDGLDDREWALVTNGQDFSRWVPGAVTPAALKHNLAAAEICIRAMEVCPNVIGAWGESYTTADMLSTRPAAEHDQIRENVGDGAIVTKEGRIVVLEVSGSSKMSSKTVGTRLVDKAAAWTAICGRTDLDLMVVFVDISPRPRVDKFRDYVSYGVNEVSERYVASRVHRERGMQRVYAVDARKWFPITRGISTDFLSLTSWSVRDRCWQQLIHSDGEGPAAHIDPVINTLGSLHVPAWVGTKI